MSVAEITPSNELPSPASALAEAEQALHDILTTGGVRQMRHGAKWVEYGPTNVGELKAYVARLRGGRINTVLLSPSKGL